MLPWAVFVLARNERTSGGLVRGNNTTRGICRPSVQRTGTMLNLRLQPVSPRRGFSGGRGFSPGVPGPSSSGVLTPEAKRARSLPPRFLASLRPPIRRPLVHGSGIKTRMRQASSSRASIASRGIPPPPTREARAKLQRTLIYGTGINFSRNSLKTKDRHHA